MKIRLMREEDVDVIRRADSLAFNAWWKQLNGPSAELPQRKRKNVAALLRKEPEGCFVAEEDGREVGFIFSRTWGSVGWFGTFAVMPEYQEQGIGKQLIAASLDYLCQDPERVIGLETMPESPSNLGLYLKQGFEPRFMTLLLTRELEPVVGDITPDLPCWSHASVETREGWLIALRDATDRIFPRLDYSKEIVSTAQHDFGEILVLTTGSKAIGMSIVWLVSTRRAWNDGCASVQVLALDPACTDPKSFRALVDASESLARKHGKQKLVLPVNSQHTFALGRLIKWGYRVDRSMVRMVLKGTDEGQFTNGCVNLSRWAG